jgi:thiol:disulfide interchange protein
VWLVAAFFNAWWGYALAGALSVVAGGVVYWGWRRTERSLKVADIL